MILTFDGALLMMEEAFWWLRPYRICPLIWQGAEMYLLLLSFIALYSIEFDAMLFNSATVTNFACFLQTSDNIVETKTQRRSQIREENLNQVIFVWFRPYNIVIPTGHQLLVKKHQSKASVTTKLLIQAPHLQQFIPDHNATIFAGGSTGVDPDHKHAHAGAVTVASQAKAQAGLPLLQLNHVQQPREAAVALNDALCREQWLDWKESNHWNIILMNVKRLTISLNRFLCSVWHRFQLDSFSWLAILIQPSHEWKWNRNHSQWF